MIIGCVVLGLVIGSFLTVCIYRIPYGREKGPPGWDEEPVEAEQEVLPVDPLEDQATPSGESSPCAMSIIRPGRSICPLCRSRLLWWHNIPFFSYLILRGRCWFCRERISIRYPLVELLTAVLCTLCYLTFGFSWTALLVFVFACALVVISFIDIDYYIIPDVISLPGTLLGLLIGVLNHFSGIFSWPVVATWQGSLCGALFGGGVLFIISEVYLRLRKRVGLGLGDVKLLAMVGAFFGVPAAFYGMFVGSLMGSIFGIVFIVLFRKKLTYQLPFGPYLALGTLLYLFTAKGATLPGGEWWF